MVKNLTVQCFQEHDRDCKDHDSTQRQLSVHSNEGVQDFPLPSAPRVVTAPHCNITPV